MHYQQRQLLTLGSKVHTRSLGAMFSAACKNSSRGNPKSAPTKLTSSRDQRFGECKNVFYCVCKCKSSYHVATGKIMAADLVYNVREAPEKHGCTLSSSRFAPSKRAKEIPRVSCECTNRAQKVHDILRDGLISFCAGWETSSDALAAEHNRFRTGAPRHTREEKSNERYRATVRWKLLDR